MASSKMLRIVTMLFVIVLVNTSVAIWNIFSLTDDASLINQTGQLRGMIQRVTKLELSHRHHDEMIRLVSDYLHKFIGKESFEPTLFDPNLRDRFYLLEDEWHELRDDIVSSNQN